MGGVPAALALLDTILSKCGEAEAFEGITGLRKLVHYKLSDDQLVTFLRYRHCPQRTDRLGP